MGKCTWAFFKLACVQISVDCPAHPLQHEQVHPPLHHGVGHLLVELRQVQTWAALPRVQAGEVARAQGLLHPGEAEVGGALEKQLQLGVGHVVQNC